MNNFKEDYNKSMAKLEKEYLNLKIKLLWLQINYKD